MPNPAVRPKYDLIHETICAMTDSSEHKGIMVQVFGDILGDPYTAVSLTATQPGLVFADTSLVLDSVLTPPNLKQLTSRC